MVVIRRELPRTSNAGRATGLPHRSFEDPPFRRLPAAKRPRLLPFDVSPDRLMQTVQRFPGNLLDRFGQPRLTLLQSRADAGPVPVRPGGLSHDSPEMGVGGDADGTLPIPAPASSAACVPTTLRIGAGPFQYD